MRDFHFPGRSEVLATNGMAATSHPLAAKVAIDILEQGGNAVDAAIAGAVLLGIAEPQSCGIGGDCFVLLKPVGSEEVIALNGSGRAPAGMSAEALRAKGTDRIGTESIDAVTIPGAIDALCRLSADHGRIGLDACLAPSIRYAEDGVPVAARVAFDWEEGAHRLQGAGCKHYLFDGKPPKVGETFRSPAHAEALRQIARHGRAGFYEGPVAEDMVATLRAAGGCHTLEDFAGARSDYGKPISTRFMGHEILEHAPNGQGATALLMLNILSRFDLARLDPFGVERTHIEAEAAKLAYDARDRFIADPASMTRLNHMLSEDTAERLAALIDPAAAMPSARRASEAVHRDTVYITVVDRDRMAVSLIYSTYWSFGVGLASDRYAILMQNRGAGFSLEPGHPNEAGPGKRPMHTIIPGMLAREGRVIMPFGVMGGGYQPNGHARFITNMLAYGMSPQAAIDAPRSFATLGDLQLERGYPPGVAEALARLGHRITRPEAPLGGAQAILIDHEGGVLIGASDPRKDGCALGC
ncbi:MAG TPA: gamma-glutamyltransferase family protein [Albidovulum sp.]|uniref:gamma-glutamyltransferase family protein n=1 Tax=Albidovulum sp. TaxID=1872424 RepID=UPI002BA5677A|nr:gamma-glutamyltransferase family protein [Albidovulum sp.]